MRKNNCSLPYPSVTVSIYIYILSEVQDRAVVVGGVQVVCFKLFKIPQPVYLNEQKNKRAIK